MTYQGRDTQILLMVVPLWYANQNNHHSSNYYSNNNHHSSNRIPLQHDYPQGKQGTLILVTHWSCEPYLLGYSDSLQLSNGSNKKGKQR